MICDESSANSSYIGTTKAENRATVISHDDQVLMYFAAKIRDPHSNPAPKVQKRFNVIHKGPDNIRREPIPDFRSLFTLFSLHLSQPAISIRAVSRINGSYHLKANGTDPEFAPLYFQFRHFIPIPYSRGDTLPVNLQGIWNKGYTSLMGQYQHIHHQHQCGDEPPADSSHQSRRLLKRYLT